MKKYTLWIDHGEAHILEPTKKVESMVDVLNINKFHPTKEQLRKFYHEIATKLSDANQILLLGPGIAKEEFKNHCEVHHPQTYSAIFKTETTRSNFTAQEILKTSNEAYDI